MRTRAWFPLAVLAATVIFPGSAGGSQEPSVALLETPAPDGASLPNLYADSERSFLLSWVEVSGRQQALRFARFGGTSWGTVSTVAEGTDWFVNWADFPSVVALDSSTLAAHWLQQTSPRHYSYGVRIGFSRDSGSNWQGPVVPHSDSTPTEHGFVSLVPFEGRLAAFWLDGRQLAGGQGAMGLWFASLSRGGRVLAEEQLDPRVCDCCQTSAVTVSDGLLVAYRDRTPGEVRDISVVRMIDGRWEAPRQVAADGWQIRACPVNGPAVAGDGRRRVAVAWFTAGADVPRVQVAFSSNAGATFDSPIRLDERNAIGRVAIVRLAADDYAVSWMEQRGGEAEIKVRRVSPSGSSGPIRAVARIPGGRGTGFPRMIPWGDGVIVAWTRPPEDPEPLDESAPAPAEEEDVDPGGIELASVRLGR